MKNLKQWKTTLIGIIALILSGAYVMMIDSANVWIFLSLLIFGTMMCFSADSFLKTLSTSVRSFMRTNKNKEI
jgi:hypothetical protein